jgi:hypothetical protein
MTILSNAEQIVWDLLKQNTRKDLYGIAIRKVIADNDVESFRDIVKELQNQNESSPLIVERVLGNAYTPLINLKYNNEKTSKQPDAKSYAG